jgi:threonyl-tRNA synthetase
MSKPRSYKELPLKFAEFGSVYRYEKSGQLGGLLRVRGFTQDDAHIFCRKDQVVEVFGEVVDLVEGLFKGFGLENYGFRLSLKDNSKDKYAGNDKQWEEAANMIRKALDQKGKKYFEAPGEAAFYGPKLDIIFNDAFGREWQISTVQVDFLLPERFNMEYVNERGEKEQPMMIHRAPLGSRERIIAILIEHFGGAFPVWLSPVQAKVIPIADKHNDYAQKIAKELKDAGLRVEIDDRSETMQAKIRDAQVQKIPYMIVVGDKEAQSNQVSVRLRTGETHNAIDLQQAVDKMRNIYLTKSLNLW